MFARDVKQIMAVGAGTGAAAAHLDAETIVQQSHGEVVMQPIDVKGNNSKPIAMSFGKNMQAGNRGEPVPDPFEELVLASEDIFHTHRLLQTNAESSAHGL